MAQRLAGGGLQPSYLRFGAGGSAQPEGQLPDGPAGFSASLHLQLGLPLGGGAPRAALPPQPAPLHERVGSACASPTRPQGPAPAPLPNLAGSVLVPLRDFAATSLAGQVLLGSGEQPLGQRHAQRSPLAAEASGASVLSGSAAASGSHSKVASTIGPRSPLTPASDGFGLGGTPLTHAATPNPADGLFSVQRLPGTLLGSARRPEAFAPARQVSYAGSGASSSPRVLRAAPSPAHSVGSRAGGGAGPALLHAGQHHQPRSPGALSDAATPGPAAFGSLGTPTSQARTPLPGAVAGEGPSPMGGWGAAAAEEPTPHPDLVAEGWNTVSPGLLQQLAEAATPPPPGLSPPPGGLAGGYALRRMSGEGSARSAAASGAATQFHTPQTSFKHLKGSLPELQVRACCAACCAVLCCPMFAGS